MLFQHRSRSRAFSATPLRYLRVTVPALTRLMLRAQPERKSLPVATGNLAHTDILAISCFFSIIY
jgi:hypothetical protein